MLEEEKEIDVRNYIIMLLSRYKTILGVMVLSAFISVFLLYLKPAYYEAKTVIENADIEGAVVGVDRVSIIINSVDVIMKVKDSFNDKYGTEMTFEGIVSNTDIVAIDDKHFSIKTTLEDAEKVKLLNDMIVNEYFRYMKDVFDLKKSLLQERLDVKEEEVEFLEKNINELRKEIVNFVKEKKITPEPVYKSILLRNVYAQHVQDYYSLIQSRLALRASIIKMRNFRVIVPSKTAVHRDSKYRIFFILTYFIYGFPVGIILVFIIEYAKGIRKQIVEKKSNQ